MANQDETLAPEEVETLCSPNRDGRDFIATTFAGLYFPDADHAFLDAAWSHVDELQGAKRALALSALCLAAAWKQPRGVFTVTTPRYDDGRRQLHMSPRGRSSGGRDALQRRRDARARPRRRAGTSSRSTRATPRSPTSTRRTRRRATTRVTSSATTSSRAWRRTGAARRSCGRRAPASWSSATRRSAPRRPSGDALDRLFDHFSAPQALVVSYGSNADLGAVELEALLGRHRRNVRRIEIPHRYAFGTHVAATRRAATEYVFVAE